MTFDIGTLTPALSLKGRESNRNGGFVTESN
jgi:hypothetical protein